MVWLPPARPAKLPATAWAWPWNDVGNPPWAVPCSAARSAARLVPVCGGRAPRSWGKLEVFRAKKLKTIIFLGEVCSKLARARNQFYCFCLSRFGSRRRHVWLWPTQLCCSSKVQPSSHMNAGYAGYCCHSLPPIYLHTSQRWKAAGPERNGNHSGSYPLHHGERHLGLKSRA